MLYEQGTKPTRRLKGSGKRVDFVSIEGKAHAFNKPPNQFYADP